MGRTEQKPVIDAMNKLNKFRKAISISGFDFSSLNTKFSPPLKTFCFNGGENKYITVNSWAKDVNGAQWVKDVKDNVISQYLLINSKKKKMQLLIIGIPRGVCSSPTIYSYIFMKVNGKTLYNFSVY